MIRAKRNNDVDTSNDIKLLYITPEKLSKSPKMKSLLHQLYDGGLLSRFVIDEAHCMSEWGHDFRSDYLSLGTLRKEFVAVPIMALTATANQKVVQDSIRIIGMKNPFLHTQSFNRPNIEYSIRKKDGKTIQAISELISLKKDLTGIIYCLSKKDTEKVANDLIKISPNMKNKITFYHADVSGGLSLL